MPLCCLAALDIPLTSPVVRVVNQLLSSCKLGTYIPPLPVHSHPSCVCLPVSGDKFLEIGNPLPLSVGIRY